MRVLWSGFLGRGKMRRAEGYSALQNTDLLKGSKTMSDSYLTIDRDFGNWFAGFVDGEGCFASQMRQCKVPRGKGLYESPAVLFRIALRADDQTILEEIRDRLGIGSVARSMPPSSKKGRGNDKPQANFQVGSTADCQLVLVPLFECHPLRQEETRL